ncbi:MAG: tRNA (guanosine(37)-N1)-methyltransferase TrmD [Oceanococcaceae bacterium]
MRFDLISVFPGVVADFGRLGVTGEACRRNKLVLRGHNLRDFAGSSRRPDDLPYGGGAGMLLQAEPLARAVEFVRQEAPHHLSRPVITLTPHGRRFDQVAAEHLAQRGGAIVLCGRYEGMDERVTDTLVDEEYSLGDFVLSGGELPALCIVDCCARLIPGVLGAEDALMSESFVDGLLEFPQYTRPADWREQPVPAVLTSGDHAKITRWRRQQALGRTFLRRPDLLDDIPLSADDRALLRDYLDTEN